MLSPVATIQQNADSSVALMHLKLSIFQKCFDGSELESLPPC